MSQSVPQGNSALDLVRVSPSPVESIVSTSYKAYGGGHPIARPDPVNATMANRMKIIGRGVSNSLDLFE